MDQENLEQESIVEENAIPETSEVEQTPEVEAAPEENAPEVEEPDSENEAEELPEGEEAEGGATFAPNTKFKAGVYNKETKQLEQKEYDIDPKFASIMKDPESEKLVRELHEKAFGLDSVKERLNETKQYATTVAGENNEIKNSINKVRTIYSSAVKSGNYLKLDDFFGALDIPEEHILKYALEKVKLYEMDPAQRNAVLAQLDTERRAEKIREERESVSVSNEELVRENTKLQVEFVLGKTEVSALSDAFDARAGKAGAFKEAVFREGNLAWNAGERLTPEQAVQRVIKNYGLAEGASAPAQNTSPGSPAKKAVVQRSTQTIPNVGGRSASPLPSKPKNLDEVVKYRKEVHGF